MDLSQLKHLALSLALLTLVGCASVPKSSNTVNEPTLELASLVGNAALGDIIELPVNNSLGMDTVVVDRTYFAASGRECRRMRDTNGEAIQRVACKGSDGQWHFARDLRSASAMLSPKQKVATNSVANQPLVPSAGSALLINSDGTVSESTLLNDSDESAMVDLDQSQSSGLVQRKLNANETLWTFAKRTTGNALNWKAIAELNNITDAKTLAPGAQLNVPVALVREGG